MPIEILLKISIRYDMALPVTLLLIGYYPLFFILVYIKSKTQSKQRITKFFI
jgi:hypothetical protein